MGRQQVGNVYERNQWRCRSSLHVPVAQPMRSSSSFLLAMVIVLLVESFPLFFEEFEL